MKKRFYRLIFFCIAPACLAQPPIKYHISFENADHHEAVVSVTFSDLQTSPLQVRMSRTSPGRYALHEFAKNVYNVKALDSKGNSLKIVRPNPHQWNIAGHDGTVKMIYTIFGDRSDGTYLAVDNTHAHMNMPATFMWARNLENRPIEITFAKPDASWNIATQLIPTQKADTFKAPDLAYFMDSPTEISDFEMRQWNIGTDGGSGTIYLAVHHRGTEDEVTAYSEMCERVVMEQIAIYGEAPRFDYGNYFFIADYLPHVNGDGMEHRNSTILSSRRTLQKQAVRNLSTVSHEFFHAWNVERIRPASLEPFDLEGANMSGELWFAEGFTSYYDGLVLKRAQMTSLDRFAEDLARTLNSVLNAPGRRFFSPVEMSMQAPFVDAATSIDPKNQANTFISYYSYGAALGIALDLTIRMKFPNLSLDDFMHALWLKHGKTEIPYTNEDLRQILGEVTGDASFADDFFDRFIYGQELPDYETLLLQAGFSLRQDKAAQAWLGPMNFDFENNLAVINATTLIDSPLYEAGLDREDVVVLLDGQVPESKDAIERILQEHHPGDVLQIEFEKNGIYGKSQLKLQPNPEWSVIPLEHSGRLLPTEMQTFRQSWLGSKSGLQSDPLMRYCPKCSRAFPFENEFCRYDGETLRITRD